MIAIKASDGTLDGARIAHSLTTVVAQGGRVRIRAGDSEGKCYS